MNPTEPNMHRNRRLIQSVAAILLTLSFAACQLLPQAPPDLVATSAYTLEKLDGHPLYVMHYQADYRQELTQVKPVGDLTWACSLFAALGDSQSMVYGRNFDWHHSPAVVVYTSPADGFASISTVNLRFLGYSAAQADDLLDLSDATRERLLQAPYLPIDGMNAAGLVVGMAAVPHSRDETDLSRPTIGSLGIMRELLDFAGSVPEALEIISKHTIDFGSGPPIHYLIADANGEAALVEYGRGELHVIPSDQPWHLATNFLLESVVGDPKDSCWRYEILEDEIRSSSGRLSSSAAMNLLRAVSQDGSTPTQWSAVYDLSTGTLHLAMGRAFDMIHRFTLDEHLP
jgi:hypothetical protein